MGVHGLSSYINQQTTLATTVTLTPATAQPIPFVIDGLAFVYFVALAEPLLGGNYHALRASVEKYIAYYRAVGLEPVLVFDGELDLLETKSGTCCSANVLFPLLGPCDASKLPTRQKRTEQAIENGVAYMNAPDWQRDTAEFAGKTKRLPPLSLDSILDKLGELDVDYYMAEGEADSRTAELAERLGGFVVSSGEL